MTFTEFVQQYNGVANVGDTPENKSQCVGLVEVWLDALNINTPHLYGNACDLLNNADSARFIIVGNSPTNAPSEGDIVVWGKAFNGNFGHTGIATKNCNDAVLEVFEANDPIGSPPHIKTYNYDNVLGWLHPRVLSGTQTTDIPPTVEQVQEQLKSQVDATTQCLTQLKTTQDQVTQLQNQLQTETDKNATLTEQLTELQTKHGEDQQEIIALNGSLENMAKSNKDYASEVVDAEAKINNLQKYLYSIADELGIVRTKLTDADIAEKSLTEIDGMDTVILEQDKQITLLKKIPIVTGQMISDVKKNGFGTFIRNLVSLFYVKNG